MSIYEVCPTLENEKFIIRQFQNEDCEDLLKVYSDENALPFCNSDNCDGENFYYDTKERMASAMDFWKMSYEKGCFARFSIFDKATTGVIGTVELCLSVSDDEFDNMGSLRVDVRNDYEEEAVLYELFSLITPKLDEMLRGKGVLTKAPIYAVERIKAIQNAGFTKSEHMLIGKTGYPYDGYWIFKQIYCMKGVASMNLI